MSGNQSMIGKILRTQQEGWQLLNLIQKISADTASEKVHNTGEYLTTLLSIFNDTQKIIMFEDVPNPNPIPLDTVGNFYDIGIAMDGTMWWKDITGWELIFTPVQASFIYKVETEDPDEFPNTLKDGDIAYTPKGKIYQKREGVWNHIYTPIELRIIEVVNSTQLTSEVGNDNDIAVDKQLKIYQKIEGVWELKVSLNAYTKEQVDLLMTPKGYEIWYESGDTFDLPEDLKFVYLVTVNNTPILPGRNYFLTEDKKLKIENFPLDINDLITVFHF